MCGLNFALWKWATLLGAQHFRINLTLKKLVEGVGTTTCEINRKENRTTLYRAVKQRAFNEKSNGT
jgi:hypothetical protein